MALSKILHAYDKCLQTYPIWTKSISSGLIFGSGDSIAQHLEWHRGKRLQSKDYVYDFDRTTRMIIWGGVLFTPIGHCWYNFLERLVKSSGTTAIIKKITLDQLVFTPPLTLAFFTSVSIMSKKTWSESLENAYSKVIPTLKVNWTVWPLIHCATFGFVPLRYRILFISFMSLGWSTFLSLMASAKTIEQDSSK